jgi:DNA-directed RNA polymerase subunit RPC12/RpoP
MTSEKITIVFDCPGCGRSMNGPAQMEFQEVKCPACGHKFFPKAKGAYSTEMPAQSTEISATPPTSPSPPEHKKSSESQSPLPAIPPQVVRRANLKCAHLIVANILLSVILVSFVMGASLILIQLSELNKSVEMFTKSPPPTRWEYDEFTLYPLEKDADFKTTGHYLVKKLNEKGNWSQGEIAYDAGQIFNIIGHNGWELAWREQDKYSQTFVVRRIEQMGGVFIVSTEKNKK